MAQMMDDGGGGGKKGGSKQKKRSTRIDMTAMVDVAFLLLTFFILTTTMATPKSMQLNVPPKPKDKTQEDQTELDVKESKVMTILMGKDNNVYWYKGVTEPEVFTTDFGDKGIREEIMKHINKPGVPRCKGKETTSGCWDPIVVLKPTESAKYKNVVDILDEMNITGTPKYALTKMTAVDSILLQEQTSEFGPPQPRAEEPTE